VLVKLVTIIVNRCFHIHRKLLNPLTAAAFKKSVLLFAAAFKKSMVPSLPAILKKVSFDLPQVGFSSA